MSNLVSFNGIVTNYTYDTANRLTGITSPVASYSFPIIDGNGNRQQVVQTEPLTQTRTQSATNYSYNSTKNRLLTAGTNSFSYDNEGELNSGYGSSYTFDYEHRLTGFSGASFSYEGSGNRLQAVRSGVTTRYIYDMRGNLLAEADGNNNITRYYIYGKGLLAMVTPAGQVYCYHYNAVGSTIALTDQNQAVVNKYAYDPFGNVGNQVETVSQPFKFVGQHGVMTEPNGFYYMKARYYDPQVGRFVSEDPIGFDGGDVNLSTYVKNNPVNKIDALGLWYVDINISVGTPLFFGGTGGVQISASGIYPYAGGGLASSGIAITWSPSDPTTGWNAGFQAGYWGGGQIGYSFGDEGGTVWWEIGAVTPGASATGFYVFQPWKWPAGKDTK